MKVSNSQLLFIVAYLFYNTVQNEIYLFKLRQINGFQTVTVHGKYKIWN